MRPWMKIALNRIKTANHLKKGGRCVVGFEAVNEFKESPDELAKAIVEGDGFQPKF